MRIRLASAAAMGMLAVQAPAYAQLTIDMSLVTCEQYFGMTRAVLRRS
jgi:hypothetical protein